MKTFDPAIVPQPSSNLPWRELDGEIFAITPDDGFLHTFNETASFIWELIDGKLNLGEIETRVLDEFEVTPEQLRGDLTDFLNRLEENHLVSLDEAKNG